MTAKQDDIYRLQQIKEALIQKLNTLLGDHRDRQILINKLYNLTTKELGPVDGPETNGKGAPAASTSSLLEIPPIKEDPRPLGSVTSVSNDHADTELIRKASSNAARRRRLKRPGCFLLRSNPGKGHTLRFLRSPARYQPQTAFQMGANSVTAALKATMWYLSDTARHTTTPACAASLGVRTGIACTILCPLPRSGERTTMRVSYRHGLQNTNNYDDVCAILVEVKVKTETANGSGVGRPRQRERSSSSDSYADRRARGECRVVVKLTARRFTRRIPLRPR
jgi:hypothetical protein